MNITAELEEKLRKRRIYHRTEDHTKRKTERLGRVSNLDNAIASTAYILDCLCALRDIYKTGCCNDCAAITQCQYVPDCGKMVRYNCPFYEKEVKE